MRKALSGYFAMTPMPGLNRNIGNRNNGGIYDAFFKLVASLISNDWRFGDFYFWMRIHKGIKNDAVP